MVWLKVRVFLGKKFTFYNKKKNKLNSTTCTCIKILIFLNTQIIIIEGPRPLGPKEIDGLLVPPGKA